jgi:glucokinase
MSPSESQYIIGVDLGGTKISVGAMPVDGSREIAMRADLTLASESGADGVVGRIASNIEAVIGQTIAETGCTRSDFIGIGVGAPGPLDRKRGIVLVAPNLGWHDYPLKERVEHAVGIRTTLENDANCATLGEWWVGAAKGAQNAIGMTIGTGIGGGLILDGKLYHGASDVAGEIGHTTIDSNGRRCACGNYGCLEAYASGPAIAERAREALAGGELSCLNEMVGGDLTTITAATVYEAAKRGDSVAAEVVRDTARFIGIGLANLLNVFNPEVVVIAGGVTQAGEDLLAPIRAEVKRRAFKAAVDACRIVPGALGGTAGTVGAVASFLAQHPA